MSPPVVVMDELALRTIVANEIAKQVQPILAALGEMRSAPAPTPLITPKEFAAILGVNARTLHRMELAGEIPLAVRIGAKTVRWRREVIDDFIATGRVGSSAKPLSMRRRRGSV